MFGADSIYSMGIEWHFPVSISVSRGPLFAKGWHSMSLQRRFCQIWWQSLRRLMTYRGKEWNCKDGSDGVVTEPRIRLALLWPNRPPYNRLNTQYPDHIVDLPTYFSRAMIVPLLEIPWLSIGGGLRRHKAGGVQGARVALMSPVRLGHGSAIPTKDRH